MRKIFLSGLLSLALVSLFSLYPQCEADFIYSKDIDALTVEYENNSGGKENYFIWIFDDTDTIFSDKKNESHIIQYDSAGTYSTCLIAQEIKQGEIECTDTVCKDIILEGDTSVSNNCYANFSYTVSEKDVTFYNESQGFGKKVFWDFGDSKYDKKTGELKHKYKEAGDYNVTLIINNEETGCFAEITKTVTVDPANIKCSAKFAVIPDITDVFKYTYKAGYSGNGEYFWEFGDGTVSNQPEIEHIYSSPGIYSISLTVNDEEDECVKSDKKNIKVALDKIELKANFGYIIDIDADSIFFKNLCIGESESFFWNYGNGRVSYLPNPSLPLSDINNEVCLTIQDNAGNYSTKCKEIEYYASEDDNANFEIYLFPETNQVIVRAFILNSVSEYFWDFGDGNTGEGYEFTHTYSDTGIYVIHLKRFTGDIEAQKLKLINVHSLQTANIAAFKLMKENGLKTTSGNAKPRGILAGDISRFRWTLKGESSDSTSLSPDLGFNTNNDSIQLCLEVFNDYLNTNRNYCQWIKTGTIDIVNKELPGERKILIFPNPALNFINVFYSSPFNSKNQISIYTVSGYLVYSGQLSSGQNQIDVTKYNTGIYLLKIEDEASTEIIKFSIMK
ncbi:MAG: PKD domain-containing protein [Bacteroidales bacterium]|nr:PKD domain-containing protein [Bacteroidales bacterium]